MIPAMIDALLGFNHAERASQGGTESPAYRAARDVERNARATRSDHGETTTRALKRLGDLLDSRTPLSRDAPRGTYLNISA